MRRSGRLAVLSAANRAPSRQTSDDRRRLSESTTAATGLVAGRSCANAGQAVATHRNAAMTGIDRPDIFPPPHLRGHLETVSAAAKRN
jgi:hypothetical protein